MGDQKIQRHRCGYLNCPSCREYVDGQTHRCFIQKALTPQELREQKKKRKSSRQGGPRAKRGAAAGLQTLRANEAEEEEEDDDDGDRPPLNVFFDIEAMQPWEQHIPNLVVAETEDDDRPVRFPGDHCLRDFLEWLVTLTQNDTRQVNVLAFETWHKEQGDRNDFQKELVAYCESDVRLLKEGCLTFKRLFEVQAAFNPFEHITIASACNRDLHMNRLIPNSIASEPVKGWRNRINQSGVALEWLTWCGHQQRQHSLEALSPEDLDDHDHPHPSHRHYIQHVRNAGEYHIPTVGFVGGYCQDTHTVYEFQGCFCHGCPRHYPNRHEEHLCLCGRTMQDVYEQTQQKMKQLQALGYNVVEMWECEWDHLKETSPDIQTFVDSLQFIKPLNPGDAFCGGRTNAVKLYHRVTPGQKIHYIDYTSLYPWVNKTCVYPKGHPRFISQPDHTNISIYFGVIQCRVLPPRELYHPVLPYRHEGKLTFPLCATCAQEEMAKPLLERSAQCAHSDEQRALTGKWCSPELHKAVELGDEVQYLYEVWQFDQTCEGLFRDCVNTWLKIKQEASGWPSWVGNDETKRQQ